MENTIRDEQGQLAEATKVEKLKQVCFSSFKLGCLGFGGIAGMIATIENEMVLKRKWLDHQHFMDVVSTSNIIPGPNSVEIMMHCGKERAGKAGLVLAGICYIFPASLICILFGFLYVKYGQLPAVQRFVYGIRPATTALVIGTVFRLAKNTLRNNYILIFLTLLVFAGALAGLNEVLLIVSAGLLYFLYHHRAATYQFADFWLFSLLFSNEGGQFSNTKLFFIFFKIGAILYGSGFVLFGYMDASLVQTNHWLTKHQLIDAIAVGQVTPGPILSSASFAGYLINGTTGAVIATAAIFLPSFFFSFFLHKILSSARKNKGLRCFLDGLSAASIAIIAVVGCHLLTESFAQWQGVLILGSCLLYMLLSPRANIALIILLGSLSGYLLIGS